MKHSCNMLEAVCKDILKQTTTHVYCDLLSARIRLNILSNLILKFAMIADRNVGTLRYLLDNTIKAAKATPHRRCIRRLTLTAKLRPLTQQLLSVIVVSKVVRHRLRLRPGRALLKMYPLSAQEALVPYHKIARLKAILNSVENSIKRLRNAKQEWLSLYSHMPTSVNVLNKVLCKAIPISFHLVSTPQSHVTYW
jgi:hypothetical protein